MQNIITVFAQDDIMKIAMSGNTITAKDIGTGKGVSFTLPELENDEFYIYARRIINHGKQDLRNCRQR